MILSLLVGFAFGLQHSTDGDHLVAVTALASESGSARRSAATGAFWGLGHLATLFVVGSVLILFRVHMNSQIEWGLELLVALVLIWLGVHTVRKCVTGQRNPQFHDHAHHSHVQLRSHGSKQAVWKNASLDLGHGPAAVLVGMAHGLAGSGGLALIVLTYMPSQLFGVIYLLVFGTGAMLGMIVFGVLIGVPLSHAAKRTTWFNVLRLTAGTASGLLGIGVMWVTYMGIEYH